MAEVGNDIEGELKGTEERESQRESLLMGVIDKDLGAMQADGAGAVSRLKGEFAAVAKDLLRDLGSATANKS